MDKQKIFKFIKNVIHNPLQISLFVVIIVVLVVIASQLTLFHSNNNKTKIMETTQKQVDINPTINVKNDDKTLISANKRRAVEELKKEHKTSKNLNKTYLEKEYDTNKKYSTSTSLYDKIPQEENKTDDIDMNVVINNPVDNNKTADIIADIQIKNANSNPFTDDGVDDNNQNKKNETIKLKPTEDLTRNLVVPKQDNKDYREKQEDYYAQIASFSDDTTDDGGFEIINASTDSSQTLNNNKAIDVSKESINSNDFVIKAGSKYYALLEIPINSIYANNVKPIAKIISGDLAGDVLIGNAIPTTNNISLILKFNRLVLPDGNEKGVNAVGINIKDVTPAFVDDIDRHLFPRIIFSTLADVINNYNYKKTNANSTSTQPNGIITTGPAQSILGSVMTEIANSYRNEIKINKQVFIVIFY